LAKLHFLTFANTARARDAFRQRLKGRRAPFLANRIECYDLSTFSTFLCVKQPDRGLCDDLCGAEVDHAPQVDRSPGAFGRHALAQDQEAVADGGRVSAELQKEKKVEFTILFSLYCGIATACDAIQRQLDAFIVHIDTFHYQSILTLLPYVRGSANVDTGHCWIRQRDCSKCAWDRPQGDPKVLTPLKVYGFLQRENTFGSPCIMHRGCIRV
jgi:hypothetical protein